MLNSNCITLNNNLNEIDVLHQSIFEVPELNISQTTTLNELVEGKLVPAGNTVELWCSDINAIGKAVQQGIANEYPEVKFYGWLNVHRTIDDKTVYLYARAYDSSDIYFNS